MVDRDNLKENYEDALFALWMDDIALEEGERLIKENAALLADPAAETPNELRSRRTIRRAVARRARTGMLRRLGRMSSRAAAAVIVFVVLFAGAYSLSPGLRAGTVNLLQSMNSQTQESQSADHMQPRSPAGREPQVSPVRSPAPTPTAAASSERKSDKSNPDHMPSIEAVGEATTAPFNPVTLPPLSTEAARPTTAPVPTGTEPPIEPDCPAVIDLPAEICIPTATPAPTSTPEPAGTPEAEKIPELGETPEAEETPEPEETPGSEEQEKVDEPVAIGLLPGDEELFSPSPEPSPIAFDPQEHVPDGYELQKREEGTPDISAQGVMKVLYAGPEGETISLEITALTDGTVVDQTGGDAANSETVVVGQAVAVLTEEDEQLCISWVDEAQGLWIRVTASDLTREELIAYAAGLFPGC